MIELEVVEAIKTGVFGPIKPGLHREEFWQLLGPPDGDPPEARTPLTVLDVALAESPETHALRVREWAAQVWRAWSPHHDVARDLAKDLAWPAQRNGA